MAEYIKNDVFSEKGREVEFGENTGKPCPSCNPQGNDDQSRYFYIRPGGDGTVEYECKNCGNSEFVPDNHDVTGLTDTRGRPLKPPKK